MLKSAIIHNIMALSRQPGQGQEALFGIEMVAASANQSPQGGFADATEHFPGEGAAVNIQDRARYIGLVMRDLNAASSRAGFQQAAASPYRAGIERRYGSATEDVVDGAERNIDANILRAKKNFEIASGTYSLIAAGVPAEQARSSTAALFRAFTAEYGVGRTTGQVRNKVAKNIQKSADIISGKKPARRGRRSSTPAA